MNSSSLIVMLLISLTSISFYGEAQQSEAKEPDSGFSRNISSSSKRWPNVIIKFNDRIFVELSVVPLSRDSILVYSTFFNTSTNGFYLYKDLLPSEDLLKESAFGIETESKDGTSLDIDFIDSSEGKYYEGTRGISPCVIPDLKSSNFILLKPGDSLRFKINVAHFYTFNSNAVRENTNFTIGYVAAMPFINSANEQVFEKDKQRDKRRKPVFYSIGMKKSTHESKYLYQRVTFTID